MLNVDLLIQYRSIQKEIFELKRHVEQIYSHAMFPSCGEITGMPRSPGYSTDGLLKTFVQVDELAEMYKKKITSLVELCWKIEAEVDKLPSIERRIIRLRYFDGRKWDEISTATGYSRSQLHRIHDKLTKDDAP